MRNTFLTYNDVKFRIIELIDKYNKHTQKLTPSQKKDNFSEANVRKDYIDLLFEILGWKVRDSDEYDAEKYVRDSGFVDIAIKINNKPLIFVEAKRFNAVPSKYDRNIQDTYNGQKIRADWTEEERQVLNYAGIRVDVKWAILTNFEKFRLFNAKTGITVLNIEEPNQYVEKLEELMLLTKRNVENGNIDKLEDRIERKDIDLDFLILLNDWRLKLAQEIRNNNSSLSLEKIQFYVQRILDRFIIIRYAEDLWILDNPDQLKATYDYWKKTISYQQLTQLLNGIFKGFDEKHDSRIFEVDYFLDSILNKIDNNLLGEIIQELYNQSFRKFTVDILGSTYESYLEHEIYEDNNQIKIRLNEQTRKVGGIYYTPPHIVDFIVKNTLGIKLEEIWQKVLDLMEDKKYLEGYKEFLKISKIKVLDLSCGSGSFLVKAYYLIKEYYDRYNDKASSINNKLLEEKITQNPFIDELVQSYNEILPKFYTFEKEILKNNIFGVDIDPQAAEIASVNLIIQSFKKHYKLPSILFENIKIGNSLISGNESKVVNLSLEEKNKLKIFDWNKEFLESFEGSKFDVIIGNPPYYKIKENDPLRLTEDFEEIQYGKMSAATLFVNKVIKLLNDDGIYGMIVPKAICYIDSWNKLRQKIFDSSTLETVIDCREAFENVKLEQVVFIAKKSKKKLRNDYQVGLIDDNNTIRMTGKGKISLAEEENLIFLEPNPIAYEIKKKMKVNVELLDSISNIVLIYNNKGWKQYSCFKETKTPNDMMFLRGDDIQRYEIRHPLFFNKNTTELEEFKDEIINLSVPHIVAQRIIAHVGDHILITAAFVDLGAFTFNTVTNIIIHNDKYSYEYLLALLNSKLISYFCYKFIYMNSIRTMDLYETYAGKIPIHIPSNDEQHFLTQCVIDLIKLKKQLINLPTYNTYINRFPRVKDETFKKYIENLGDNPRSFIDSNTDGLLEKIWAVENDRSILVYVNGIIFDKKNQVIRNKLIYSCQFPDYNIRKFILFALNYYKSKIPSVKNIIKKILLIPIPTIISEYKLNKKEINKIMPDYIKIDEQINQIKQKIDEIEKSINQYIYNIYQLSDKEIKVIEEHFSR